MADVGRRDELEAQALYELLGKSVAPLFYDRDADGVPLGWVERIRHTLRSLGPKVQAERMVREYVTELYVPAARGLRARWPTTTAFGPARELAAWKQRVVAAWPQVRIEHVESEAAGQRAGLGADRAGHGGAGRADHGRRHDRSGVRAARRGRRDHRPAYATLAARSRRARPARVRYSGEVPLDRPGPFGYTVRVLPRHRCWTAGPSSAWSPTRRRRPA